MTRTRRPRASERVPASAAENVGMGFRYARVSQDARTVHAIRRKFAADAICGATVPWMTYGEEQRLPLCARCHKIAEAEFLAELDDPHIPAER